MGEDIAAYALIGDMGTAALVSTRGSIDWLCWPDFDSEACFTSIIGTQANGCWSLSPKPRFQVERRYAPATNVLETVYHAESGVIVKVTDFMPKRDRFSCLIRIVRGIRGSMKMQTAIAPRFDYGGVQPLLQQGEERWTAIAGPHRLDLWSNVRMDSKEGDLHAEWPVAEGDVYFFTLQHSMSYGDGGSSPPDALKAEREAIEHWQDWCSKNTYKGPYKQAVERSLLTLKHLTYAVSGGFVAAPTTSLPEKLGGVRNWDYRFCWLRDSTFALLSLVHCGYHEEARNWLNWLSRSALGAPKALKILYGVTGKHEHSEWSVPWLDGYKGSKPVHVGNKAADQLQLDTFGEVMDSLYRARCHSMYPLADQSGEALEIPLLKHLETVWADPDAGLWEFRSARQQFTQSKVMAWVAFDRGIRMVEKFGMKGPVEHWRRIRTEIHAQVCQEGFHKDLNSFTQVYGTKHLDASLLFLPLVGFLPIEDERISGTVKAIEKYLLRDGLLMRYNTSCVEDGLPAGEGAFLACSFWLVEVYVLQERRKEAEDLFERLLRLSNDVQLLSEEYDSKHGLIGNFPQALSHIGLINSALALATGKPVRLGELS